MARVLSAFGAVMLVCMAAYVVERTALAATPTCVKLSSRAQYSGFGYKHIVTVKNTCQQTATCKISTDVDPKPVYTLVVKPGEEDSVVTRIGSPASAFKANADCTLPGGGGGGDGRGPT